MNNVAHSLATKRRFPKERADEMAQLREKGWSYARIADRFNVSPGCIAWHCLLLGATPANQTRRTVTTKKAVVQRGNHLVRRFTPTEDAQLLALERSGSSYSEIARSIGRRRNSVLGRLLTLGLREERSAA